MKNGSLIGGLLAACVAISMFQPVWAEVTPSDSFVLGVVSKKAKKRIESSQPLADWMAKRLTKFGYQHGTVVVAQDMPEMKQLLRTGKVDLISASVYSALMFEKYTNAKIVAKRWKKRQSHYHSVFFTHVENDDFAVSDLAGKTILFERPSSHSGYFAPAVTLLEYGYRLEHLEQPDQQPKDGNIGFLFIDDVLPDSNEVNMTAWTYGKRVDAAVFSSDNWNSNKDTPASMKDKLKIFYQTDNYPRELMLVSEHVSDEMTHAIKAALLDVENDEAGRLALEEYQKTTKFEELPASALATLDVARVWLQEVENLSVK